MTGYRCPKCGVKGFKPKCWNCGAHMDTYECGPPVREEGCPAVIGDKLHKYFDWAAGAWIGSRTEQKKVYKAKGMQLTSVAEHRRQNATNAPLHENTARSYAGQKSHRSTAERPRFVTGPPPKRGRRTLPPENPNAYAGDTDG